MKRTTMAATLLALAATALAQDAPVWNEGDRVETRNPSTTLWEPATVIRIEDWRPYGKGFAYRVRLDDKNAANPEWATTAEQVRPLAAAGAASAFKAGDRVDVFYDATHGKNRGVVLEAAPGKYKVHYTGCGAHFDEWVDRLALHAPAALAASAPEVKFLVGNWAMFTPSYPNTVIRGEDIYREYGPGAKSPPLSINGDGSYVWYYDFGRAPVKGTWTADAKVPGADMGEQAYAGVVIADPTGRPWKVYRVPSPAGDVDRIEARRMCSGEVDMGTRLR
jgi:hypothetical protein